MKHSNLRYLTREGLKNIFVNRLMSVASIAVLMSCLIMIGCAVLLYFNIDSLLHSIEAQNMIMVFVKKDADETVLNEVQATLESNGNIATVKFVPKNEAYATILESLGENAAIMEDVDASFLPDGFEVTVKDMQFFSQTVNEIRGINNVISIRENSDLAARLEKIRTAVFIVSLFIIANTIRISMYTRRLEISIMKAVGATNSFIRWPFLIEGITIGLISAVVGMAVLYLIYRFAGDALLTIFGVFGGSLINFLDYALYLFIGFVVVSVITAGIGSIFSIGRYLKEQGSVVDENN